ncbi:unnamed protein product [Lepeophtheirus salmonis]|uniref:(salmon louse) hypothetical protein n=1 Tax=Lepeophtheirus salmonis TaxID=72036 RepID=A0A7R8CJD3_LEPSM|nr:unnamed protein product [Lepeophtheirus salmonis]CAF2804531.1 unnamed protein product [Lepeophtheirus salmonis]
MVSDGAVEEYQGSWIGENWTSGSGIEGEKLDKNGKNKVSTCRDQEKDGNSKKKNRSTRDEPECSVEDVEEISTNPEGLNVGVKAEHTHSDLQDKLSKQTENYSRRRRKILKCVASYVDADIVALVDTRVKENNNLFAITADYNIAYSYATQREKYSARGARLLI